MFITEEGKIGKMFGALNLGGDMETAEI